MSTQDTKPFLKQERSQTDESLTCERGKTDEGLHDLRKKTENKTDALVQNDRVEADLAKSQTREAQDSNAPADANLEEQRQEFDKSLKAERSNVDAAIRAERLKKEAVLTEFLHKERSETDGHLLEERKRTDHEVTSSSRLLRDEVDKHTVTKAELTSREDLMALVSHDLRNPIGAVLSCADMLLEDEEHSALSSETKYWIEFIKRNAASSLRLISDILDMERIAKGKLNLIRKNENLGEVIRHANELFVYAASAKGVLLRGSIPTIAIQVSCDRERIMQILSNLIGNALKFTPEGGKIVVKSEETPDEVKISVCDTGKGIADTNLEKIFERYSQLDKKDSRGIGLGLHICKALVESHGGKLWVESTVGHGSTFFFTLPKTP